MFYGVTDVKRKLTLLTKHTSNYSYKPDNHVNGQLHW